MRDPFVLYKKGNYTCGEPYLPHNENIYALKRADSSLNISLNPCFFGVKVIAIGIGVLKLGNELVKPLHIAGFDLSAMPFQNIGMATCLIGGLAIAKGISNIPRFRKEMKK